MKNSSIKILLVFFFLGVITFSSKAQEERKGFIGLNVGTSIPIGDFSDDNINNDRAGFALNGTSINLIDFGYRFGKIIGITASISGGVYELGEANSGLELISVGFFLGPLISIPLNNRLNLNLVPKAGSTSSTLQLNDTELSTEKALGFDMGVTLQYSLGKKQKWALNFFGSYIHTDLEEGAITAINGGLGIAFRLR